MTAAASFLALYAAPNTRGAGPRPPRWVLAALACFWLAVLVALTGCVSHEEVWGRRENRTAVVCVDGADFMTAFQAALVWRDATEGAVNLTLVQGREHDCTAVVRAYDLPDGIHGRAFADGEIFIDPLALADVTVYAHELGHFLLGYAYTDTNPAEPLHSPDRESIMYEGGHLGTTRVPLADDVRRLP